MNIRRHLARVRIRLLGLYKRTIGRFLLQHARFNRILMDKGVYLQVKNRQDFVLSVQLARFVNTIRSVQRAYLRVPDTGSLPNTKDKIESQYTYAAVIYEIVQSLGKLFGKLKHFQAWKTKSALVAKINAARGNSGSYYNTVLRAIRNEVAFHFDPAAIHAAVNLVKLKDRMVLATSRTLLNRDMVFNLVDDLVLNYVISKDATSIPDIDKYEMIGRQVIGLSEAITELCSSVVLEIWQHLGYSDRGRLES